MTDTPITTPTRPADAQRVAAPALRREPPPEPDAAAATDAARPRPAEGPMEVARLGDERPQDGNTIAEQQGSRRPRLPHERDESRDSQPNGDAAVTDIGEQAHADAVSPRVDTDRGLWAEEREAGGPDARPAIRPRDRRPAR